MPRISTFAKLVTIGTLLVLAQACSQEKKEDKGATQEGMSGMQGGPAEKK